MKRPTDQVGEESLLRGMQRAWFETTLDSISDAVIATDLLGRIVFMNAIAVQLTGWSRDDAIGRRSGDVFRVLSPDSRQPVEEPVHRFLAQTAGRSAVEEAVLLVADGTERPIESSGAPIRNDEGAVIGGVLVFRDVTERRRLEAERLAVTLERERLLDAERTARAEAERASRANDDFVAMVSHELRTPLNAILGWTQLMSRAPHDRTIVERGLQVMERNTRLQAQLISDLLDISRIVAGTLNLEFERVDLLAVINEAIDVIAQEATARGVTIHWSPDQPQAAVTADPARLQQIVWNLLSNAVKFTPPGGSIHVSANATDSETRIVVADTGAGIRSEFIPLVFDRFHQADRSITRRFGGLGLGLTIVKHLTQLHGGRVTAESAGEGGGSTFTVVLPASPARAPAHSAVGGGVVREPLVAVLDGICVLAVEDEPDTLYFLKSLLQEHGATVHTATNARDALDVFRAEQPDLLISDIGLPEVDGYDLMQQIRRETGPGQRVTAIAVSAYSRAEDRTRALKAGFQAHVAKPVEAAQLLALISSFGELTERARPETGDSRSD